MYETLLNRLIGGVHSRNNKRNVSCIRIFTGEPSDEYRDLTYSKSEGIETYANGTLYIQSVTQSHEGYFLCQAKNEIGAGLSKLIRLTVHGMFSY